MSANATLLLQTTTTSPLPSLLAGLKASLLSAGVWIHSRRNLSAEAAELEIELHNHSAQEFYTALIECGVHLSHPAHIALAALCSPRELARGGTLHCRLQIRSLTSASLFRLNWPALRPA